MLKQIYGLLFATDSFEKPFQKKVKLFFTFRTQQIFTLIFFLIQRIHKSDFQKKKIH